MLELTIIQDISKTLKIIIGGSIRIDVTVVVTTVFRHDAFVFTVLIPFDKNTVGKSKLQVNF